MGGFGVIGGLAWGGIEGSKHDFRSQEWTKGDACVACHTPQSDPPMSLPPLWDPNADLNRTFGTSLYQSQRAGAGTAICIRCHDGTIARDTVGVPMKERLTNREHPGRWETGHGISDHPVGVEYPAVAKDYRPATTVVAGGQITLPNGKVECISCHDPHHFSGEVYMLVKSNDRSALCLSCHRK